MMTNLRPPIAFATAWPLSVSFWFGDAIMMVRVLEMLGLTDFLRGGAGIALNDIVLLIQPGITKVNSSSKAARAHNSILTAVLRTE